MGQGRTSLASDKHINMFAFDVNLEGWLKEFIRKI